jgi:MFS family permease
LAAVGWITGAFYVARIPAGAGGGRLIDRFGRRPVLQTAFFVSVGALLLTALLQQPALLVLCALALGVQAAVVPVGLTTWVGDHARAENRPYTYAAVALWSNMGTGLAILGGPWLLTVLGGWRGIFGFFAAIFLICALLARRLD